MGSTIGYWRFSQEKMQKMYEMGLIVRSKTGKSLSQKMYLDESKGRQIDNFWYDINKIAPNSKEGLGYPTQKPELLLERIINTSSKVGDLVLDCYCGCGTSIAVSERLKRNWIGIDITYQSISLILKRFEDTFGEEALKSINLNGVPQDLESAKALAHKDDDRMRKEFEKWSILTYSNNRAIINEKKGADKGIDGIAFILHNHDKETREVIFSVKSGGVGVSQVRDLRGVIERENAAMGILIVLEEPTKPMLLECKQAGFYENELFQRHFDRLQIVTVEEILSGKRLSLPMSYEILNKAERKNEDKDQQSLF